MKRSILKKYAAFALAGSMLISSVTVTAFADGETSIPIYSAPQLKVEDPAITSTFGAVTADKQVFSDVDLNVIQEPTFEDVEDGIEGFNGAYTVAGSNDQDASNVDNPFNMSGGNYPMFISFKVKVDGSLSDGDYNLVGKMDNEYGIQLKVENSGTSYKIVAYCMQTSSNWPTFYVTLNNPSEWTSVVVAFTGSTFWISTDGGITFGREIQRGNTCELKNVGDWFSIGCNTDKTNNAIIPSNIYLADIQMYRSYTEEEGEETAETAKTLYDELGTEGTKILDVYAGMPYTVDSTWYEGDTATGNPASSYTEGNTYTLRATLTAKDGYFFNENSKPSTIKVGYFSTPVTAEVDPTGNTMTVTCTYSGADKPTGIETEYWDSEVANNTLTTQNEEDAWLYQIKLKEGLGSVWENIPDTVFNEDYLGGTWMQGGDVANEDYGWSKINRTEITCNFTYQGSPENIDYDRVAYAWQAPADGYYYATLAKTIGASGSGFKMYISHTGSDTPNVDGDVLLAEKAYSAGQTIKSPIAKVKAGDIIRFVSTAGWATGFEPMIEEVTVREYAEQYRDDMSQVVTANYTEASVGPFTEALEQLKTVLDSGSPETETIEDAVTALETAYAGLVEKYTVTYKIGTEEHVMRHEYNDVFTTTVDPASQAPEGQSFIGWCLGEGEDAPIISTAPTCTFYVSGDMVIVAKFGSAEEEVPADVSIPNVHVTPTAGDANQYDIQFISQVFVPEGHGLKEAGLLWSTEQINESVTTTSGPATEGTGVRQVSVSSVSTAHQYSVTITGVPADEELYAIAYARVTDSQGRDQWLYSSSKNVTATVE